MSLASLHAFTATTSVRSLVRSLKGYSMALCWHTYVPKILVVNEITLSTKQGWSERTCSEVPRDGYDICEVKRSMHVDVRHEFMTPSHQSSKSRETIFVQQRSLTCMRATLASTSVTTFKQRMSTSHALREVLLTLHYTYTVFLLCETSPMRLGFSVILGDLLGNSRRIS